MRCLNCDALLEPRARSCRACGFATGRECERCGYVSLADATYCGGCGQSLHPSQGAEHRQLTVMFCDLVSSTALSERLPPEDLQALLRSYQRTAARIVRQAQGHIAQYLGDGILAYFGVPSAQEGAARQAVLAGMEIPEACRGLAGHGAALDLAIKVRVGIHTGPALLTEMGDTAQTAHLAVGETPNIAARLQAMAGENEVFVSAATRELVEGQFVFEDLGERSLKGLSRAISVHRVVGLAQASPGFWRPTRGPLSPLVGRAAALGALEAAWRNVDGGGSAVVLLRGQAGVGKSRLVSELRNRIAAKQVLEAYCSPTATATAFHPLRAIFGKILESERGATGPAEGLASIAKRLGTGHAQVLAELLDFPGFGPFPIADPRKRRLGMLQVFCDVLADFGALTPTLLLLEDLHWLDASTLEFLSAWRTTKAASSKVLLVLTARPDAALDLGEGVQEIELGPLPDAEGRELLRSLFADDKLSDPVMAVLLERCAGVPLYLEEIGKAVRSGRKGDDAEASPVSAIPATLQESLLARLDQLGQARALAQLMATIGRSTPFAWLVAVSAAPVTVLHAQLDRLIEAEIVELEASSDERYAFRHALIQQIARDSLTRPAREEYHRRVADALTSEFEDFASREPSLVGHHYAEAGQHAQAVAWLGRAAQKAMLASAFQETASILGSALDLLSRCPDTPARDAQEIELRRVHGLALTLTRGYSAAEVEQTYSRARALCERSGSVPLHVLYGVYAYHLVRGDARTLNRLVPMFERFLPDSGAATADREVTQQEREAELVSRAAIAVRAFFRGEYDDARIQFRAAHACVDVERIGEQHERLMRQYGFDGALVNALWIIWADMLQGRLAEAEQGRALVLSLARDSGHAYLEAQASAYMAALARELGDLENARALAARTLELSQEHGFVFWLAFGLCVMGWVSVQSGDVPAGIAMIQQGLGILEGIGSLVNFGYFLSFLVEAHLHAGGFDAGLAVVERAINTSREGIGGNYEPELLRLRGTLLLAARDEAGAIDHFRAAIAEARLQNARLLELKAANSLAALLASRGEHAAARAVLLDAAKDMLETESCAEIDRARVLLKAHEGVPGSVISDQTLS